MEESKRWKSPPGLWRALKLQVRRHREKPTPSEERLWSRLKNRSLGGFKFRRQHAINRFYVDFYCAEAGLVVEADGPIHERQVDEDRVRREFLESVGLRVLRFTNQRIDEGIESVLDEILAALKRPR